MLLCNIFNLNFPPKNVLIHVVSLFVMQRPDAISKMFTLLNINTQSGNFAFSDNLSFRCSLNICKGSKLIICDTGASLSLVCNILRSWSLSVIVPRGCLHYHLQTYASDSCLQASNDHLRHAHFYSFAYYEISSFSMHKITVESLFDGILLFHLWVRGPTCSKIAQFLSV